MYVSLHIYSPRLCLLIQIIFLLNINCFIDHRDIQVDMYFTHDDCMKNNINEF